MTEVERESAQYDEYRKRRELEDRELLKKRAKDEKKRKRLAKRLEEKNRLRKRGN